MRLRFVLILGILVLSINCLLAASTEININYPVDIMAMGGCGITSYDTFGMIYMNPAAFGMPEFSRLSILKTGVSLNYDLYNYYNIYGALSKNNNDI